MDEKELAEILIGEPALAFKMRDNGEFVVVDPKGNKWVFYPDQVAEARASAPKGEPAKPGRARAKEETQGEFLGSEQNGAKRSGAAIQNEPEKKARKPRTTKPKA